MNRRDMRRKRRVRNQIISYIVAVLILAGIVTGGVMGIRSIASAMEEKKAAEESQAQAESLAQEEAMMQSQTENETGEAQTEPPVENVPSKEELLEELVESCVANMSLEDKVAGLFIVTPEQLTGVTKAVQAGSGTEEALKKYPVGGLVYFAQNIQSAEQLKEMLSKTAGYATYPLFLGVDEEGGSVARVADQLKLTMWDRWRILERAVTHPLHIRRDRQLALISENMASIWILRR